MHARRQGTSVCDSGKVLVDGNKDVKKHTGQKS
mgnify:CR=1 FL=1